MADRQIGPQHRNMAQPRDIVGGIGEGDVEPAIFGLDFGHQGGPGGRILDAVVRAVDVMNREDKTGRRRVRIHAIGFPVRPDAPQYTSIRFASLMRILCDRNGGTFVGLNEPSSYRR